MVLIVVLNEHVKPIVDIDKDSVCELFHDEESYEHSVPEPKIPSGKYIAYIAKFYYNVNSQEKSFCS